MEGSSEELHRIKDLSGENGWGQGRLEKAKKWVNYSKVTFFSGDSRGPAGRLPD